MHAEDEPLRSRCAIYKITPREYNRLRDQQGFCCAICGKPEGEDIYKNKPALLKIDHCHTTGEVRGLLCQTCNIGLGHFKDSTKLLKSAIRYLTN